MEDPRNAKRYSRVVLDCPDWVNVIAVTTDEKVVLIRQFRFGTWTSTLEIPGGMVDPERTLPPRPRASSRRRPGSGGGHCEAGCHGAQSGDPEQPAAPFLATGCVKVHEGAQEETEDIVVELAPKAEIGRLVREGRSPLLGDHGVVVLAADRALS